VVAGLLRENQIELALEQAALMERKDIFIENWLHGMIIYTLCDHQEFHEVFDLMVARVDQGHDMSTPLWAHVLTTAAEALHHPTVRFVWRRTVELGYMNPPAEVCNNVLKVASKVGDIELSSSVFRYLVENNIQLGQGQHEHLIEAHVSAGNLPAAFEALCTMHESGTPLANSSTEAILAYMIEHKTDRREAWQMLKRLKNEKRSIPLDCVRVISDLCEHDAHEDPSVVEDGVGFYKELYTLCPDGADVRVYNALIRMCRIAKDRQSGMFLVKEMASLGVVPNAITFESIILMCLDAGNFRSGFMYFQDLIKRDAKVSLETQKEILELCSESVDEFAMRLQYHPSIREDVQKLDKEIQQQKEEWRELQESGDLIHPAVRRMNMPYDERVAWNKARRKNKRRLIALAKNKGEGPEGAESPENGSE
jgi:mRNA-degrading endonuclease RelE of RelBE toxin-antitoxin system